MKSRIVLILAVLLAAWAAIPARAFDGFIGITNGYFYDTTSGEPFVPHGIAYQTWNRPLGVWQTHDQIEYDLDEMVKMGANSVRIDIVWQHAEEQGDDIFTWDNYDFFIRECEKRNIRIFALIGYQWPPSWFPDEWYTQHPPATDSSGIIHTQRWQSDIINYEHPQARAQYSNWIATVTGRYKDEKAIAGWIVGNESGYLGLWSGLLDGYDPETVQAFRGWASNKYATVANANAAWGTSYTSFDEVDFPDSYYPYGPEGAVWADAVQFREDSIGSFTAVGAMAAKAANTNHLISYSTVGMQWGEEDWRYHAEDRGKITEACAAAGAPIDFFSVNNYPWSILGHESQNGHWGISFTKKVANVPVLYSETGFTSSETMWPGMNEERQGQLIVNSLWESLEAGAIGTHIFSWMDRPYITDREKGFGIVYADRRIKPAFWESRDAFTLMKQVQIQDLLMGSKDPVPNIAFLWTAANDSQYNRYETEMQQYAGVFERLGYEPYFMNIDDLGNGVYSNYDVLVLPRNMRVEDTVPNSGGMGVLEFIANKVIPAGVNIIAGADIPGMQNENGLPLADYTQWVDQLFGVDAGNPAGYEIPARWGDFVSGYWHPLDIYFNGNAVAPLGSTYSYRPYVWKYSDEVKVTDGTVWATMDSNRNKGFEDSDTAFDKWDGTWGNAYVRSGWGWAYDGNNMAQMWGSSGMWKDFPEVANGRYAHSAYLRANASDPLRGGAYAVLATEHYGKNNNLWRTDYGTPLVGSTPNDSWVQYTLDTTAPALQGDSFFDDKPWTGRRIIKTDIAPQNLLANGGLDGTGNAPDSWSEWNNGSHDPDTSTYHSSSPSWKFWWDGGIFQDITSGFQPGDVLKVGGWLYTEAGAGTPPALSNAGFEDDASGTSPPSNWTKSGNGGVWVETQGFADGGTKVAKIYQGWANQSTAIFQELNAAAGDQFVGSAKVYDWSSAGNPMQAGDKAYIVMEWKDASGADLGGAVTSSVVTSSSGQNIWHALSVSGTAPANTAKVRLLLVNEAGGNNNVDVYFDTTSLTLQNPGGGDPLRNGTKYGVLQVEFYDAADALISIASAAPTINQDSAQGTWIRTEGDFTVPASAAKARVVVRCNDYTSGDGTFFADDLFAYNTVYHPNLIQNGTLAGTGSAPDGWSQWNDGSHDPDSSASHSGGDAWAFWWDGGIYQDVTQCVIPNDTLTFGGFLYTPGGSAGAPPVTNPGFEDDASGTSPPSGWTKSGNGGVWVETQGFADGGTKVAKIYQGWANQSTAIYQDLPLSAGDQITASVKIYDWSSAGNPMQSGDKAYLAVEWKDANGVDLGGALTSPSVTSASGQDAWHTVSVSGTAPANTATVRLLLTLEAGGNNNVDAYFDTTTLTLQSSSDPLRNGTKYGVVQLEFYNGATWLSTASASPTISASSPRSTWVYAEGSATVPAGATKARVVVRCNDYASGDGRFLADDIFVRNVSPGGSVFVDNNAQSPALVVKDHGTAKAALFLYAVADMKPDGNEDNEMDVLPWKWRYDIFKSLVQNYMGVQPDVEFTGTNDYLALAEYRTLSDGSTLWQVKNYMYDTNVVGGGEETFTLNSPLFTGKTIQAFEDGKVVEENSDGTIQLSFEGDGMEMLHVFDPAAGGGSLSPIVQIKNAPGSVHPFGAKSYQVYVQYDALTNTDLTLKLSFEEVGDNGDGTPNESYQLLSQPVTGSGTNLFYVWIPNYDQSDDPDYISSPDGGQYQFRAWLENGSSAQVAAAVPEPVQLLWGVRPVNGIPATINKGDQVAMDVEWEGLNEYLSWENTPLLRNEAYPDRVAVFRSLKTEAQYPGHLDRVNEVCDWLQSMGYQSGNYLDIAFDNISVSNAGSQLFFDDFSDGDLAGWSRVAGAANWEVNNGALRAWRIGNDDNIREAGSVWTNYTLSADVKYLTQGPYFNDIDLYVRYQDRDNFVKVGIRNFYGFWRLRYQVRVDTNFVDQAWIHDFPKTNRPVEDVWYNLRVDVQGDTYTVYFDDAQVSTFTVTNFPSGKIAVGSKATQLGIWDPQKGYYFIDDDEYSFYSPVEGQIVTLGSPLNLDWGYLQGFFPTLVLPGTYVMSDIEASNVVTWINAGGMRALITTDGGVAQKDETGAVDMGRIEDLFGVSPSVSALSGLSTLTVGGDDHYVTLDYDNGAQLPISGSANAWNVLTTGTGLGTMANGSVSAPAVIVNTLTNDPAAPNKVVALNFQADTGGQLTNGMAQIAKRAFEWARGEAYRVTVELKYDTGTPNAQDFTILTTNAWLTTSSGTNTIYVNIPDQGIMTGTNIYWVMYVHPWDSADPFGDEGGFYTSDDDSGGGNYTTIPGVGLQILGITPVAYAGRDWDKWIAYNTQTQTLWLTFGTKDKGLITDEDNFDDGNYNGWNEVADPNITWSVPNGAVRATVVGSGGYAYLTRDGLSLNDTNVTIEYDVYFGNGATNGGLIYRGRTLYLNPYTYGWDDDNPQLYPMTNWGMARDQWHHVIVNIRDGDPYLLSDVRLGTNIILSFEPIETTNFTTNTVGLLSPYYGGYVEWDNVRVADEQYAMAYEQVSGVSYPSNGYPTGIWPTTPDYDDEQWEHAGTLAGADYEWFIYFRGEPRTEDRLDVDVYFAPRLQVESTNFPTSMGRGDTASVPVEWEDLGTNLPIYLRVQLEEPYLGTNLGSSTFTITNATGSGLFDVTVDANAPSSTNYSWVAFFYPTGATNAMLQRLGLDDTFRFQPVPEGAPIESEITVTVNEKAEIYNDLGIPVGSDILTWSGGSGTWDANYTILPPPEGVKSFYTLSFIDWIGWGIFRTSGTVDMSSFTGGYLKFWLWSFETLKVQVEGPAGTKGTVNVGSTGGVWKEISIPLSSFGSVDLGRIYGYFMITSYDGAEYLVDDIRYSMTP